MTGLTSSMLSSAGKQPRIRYQSWLSRLSIIVTSVSTTSCLPRSGFFDSIVLCLQDEAIIDGRLARLVHRSAISVPCWTKAADSEDIEAISCSDVAA